MKIARAVLTGRLAMLQHRFGDAAQAFEQAVAEQDQYSPHSWDPPPWWYPVRRSLAYADLAAGKPADAAREAKASLKDWPDDALALRVLGQAEARLGDAKASA